MRAQRDWGFEVDLACAAGDYAAELRAEGFTLHHIPFERSFNLLAHRRAGSELKRLIRERRYQVVHTHTPVASLIARPAARRAGAPLVIYTAHGFYFHDAMPPWQRRLHVGLERWAQRYADFLMTQSAEDAATAVHEKIERADRVAAIGNGIDVSRFRPDLLAVDEHRAVRESLGVGRGEGPVVTILGRIVREKGYLEFARAWVRAAKEFPQARAVVVGEALPSDREDALGEVRRILREAEIDETVRFAGYRNDVPRVFAASDVFVLPSWREGMPRSIIEAMASNLPVIATDIRGCREEVVEGETGFLVPARDPDRLADRLIALLSDESLRRRMGEAGRRRAEELFDERKVIERQEEIFRKLYQEKGLMWPGDS